MKQIKTTQRPTTDATSERRRELQEELNEKLHQINDFKCFVDNVDDHAESFRCVKSEGKLSMFLTDPLGKTVVQFFLFQEVNSPFGFLQLAEAQKNGVDVPKNVFNWQKKTIFFANGHNLNQLTP